MTSRCCVGTLAIIAGLAGCGQNPETTYVARAGGHDLTVAQGAAILAAAETLPDDTAAARGVMNLWVDYVLLATAVSQDSTLSQLELGALVEREAEQALLTALRDSIQKAGTTISGAEFRRRYADEAPGSEIRARQILLALPEGASPAQEDSVRAAIRALRTRIVDGGEDFAELARQHSADARTAAQGGDMGFFGRGDMVPPFEEAAYGLRPGQVSEPVRTAYGYHLVRLEARRTPTEEAFRDRLTRQRGAEAVNGYVASLEARANPEIHPRAVELLGRIAADPGAWSAARDTLIRYREGAVTADRVATFLERRPAQLRRQISGADPDEVVNGILLPILRQELLRAEARKRAPPLPPEDRAAREDTLRERLRGAARRLGLMPPPDSAAESGVAVERRVEAVLRQIVADERRLIPFGPLSLVLRKHYGAEVREDRAPLIIDRLRETRRASGGAPAAGAAGSEEP